MRTSIFEILVAVMALSAFAIFSLEILERRHGPKKAQLGLSAVSGASRWPIAGLVAVMLVASATLFTTL